MARSIKTNMITITVTIETTDNSLILKQAGTSNGPDATDEECNAANIISEYIHQGFLKAKPEDSEADEIIPYTRLQKRKSQIDGKANNLT